MDDERREILTRSLIDEPTTVESERTETWENESIILRHRISTANGNVVSDTWALIDRTPISVSTREGSLWVSRSPAQPEKEHGHKTPWSAIASGIISMSNQGRVDWSRLNRSLQAWGAWKLIEEIDERSLMILRDRPAKP